MRPCSKMASTKAVQGLKHAKIIFSADRQEARRRVLNLYKSFYRQVPISCQEYHLSKTHEEMRAVLRQQFEKNRHVEDIRVIDMLIIKGQQELQEIVKVWKMSCHILTYFKETENPKPTDFMGKFLDGHAP